MSEKNGSRRGSGRFVRRMVGEVRAGLVWVEVLAAVVTVAVVAACLAAAVPRQRHLASLGQTMANLRQIGDAFATYGGDYQDRVLGYSWTPGNCPSQFPDLKTATDAVSAAANQAVDILRRRSGNASFIKVNGWLPHVYYWNLIVADYLNTPLPHALYQSPEDQALLKRASDPANWNTGTPNDRWALSTSYEVTAGAWGGPDSGSNAISQDGQPFNLYLIPGAWTGAGRQLSEFVYPSKKALVFDRYQWHFGPRVGFFMYDEARVPAVAADGSATLRAGSNTNPGWKPNSPTNPQPSFINYNPPSSGLVLPVPPPLNNAAGDLVKGRLRYTRGGLAGRDFDGPEVP